MISGRLLCVAIAIAIAVAEKAEGERVAQVHLSLTGDLTSMGLDYVSSLDSYSAIEYTAQDPSSSTWTAPGTAPGHSATASLARSTSIYYENIGFLHTAVLDNLLPKTVYAYRIGDANSDSWSDQWFHFTTGPYERSEFYRKGESIESVSGEGVAAVYADLGVYNGLSVNRLLHEANQSIFDYTLHIGDISYDLFSDNSSVGNTYMNMMEPITSKFPLMVGEGNHEKSDNFTEYNYRFKSIENLAGKNSKSNSNHFYSFDVGLVHYIMVSTEVYNYPTQARDGPSPFTADEQLTWLEEDLVKANDPAQRKKVPWIVLMGHRPWYTTEFEVSSGTSFHDFDDLGCQYGVDLYITGHVHNYQRYHPLRTGSSFIPKEVDTDCVSSDGHVYTDPKFMPTIVAGSTGCHSPLPRVACPVMAVASDLFLKDALAHCSAAYGFGHLQVTMHFCFDIYENVFILVSCVTGC